MHLMIFSRSGHFGSMTLPFNKLTNLPACDNLLEFNSCQKTAAT